MQKRAIREIPMVDGFLFYTIGTGQSAENQVDLAIAGTWRRYESNENVQDALQNDLFPQQASRSLESRFQNQLA